MVSLPFHIGLIVQGGGGSKSFHERQKRVELQFKGADDGVPPIDVSIIWSWELWSGPHVTNKWFFLCFHQNIDPTRVPHGQSLGSGWRSVTKETTHVAAAGHVIRSRVSGSTEEDGV